MEGSITKKIHRNSDTKETVGESTEINIDTFLDEAAEQYIESSFESIIDGEERVRIDENGNFLNFDVDETESPPAENTPTDSPGQERELPPGATEDFIPSHDTFLHPDAKKRHERERSESESDEAATQGDAEGGEGDSEEPPAEGDPAGQSSADGGAEEGNGYVVYRDGTLRHADTGEPVLYASNNDDMTLADPVGAKRIDADCVEEESRCVGLWRWLMFGIMKPCAANDAGELIERRTLFIF